MDPSSHRLFHQVDRGSPYKECYSPGHHEIFYENIFIRFGFLVRLVTDNAPAFKSRALVKMCESMGIQLVHSTSSYPQGNVLAESSNKILVRIIRKLLETNQKRWDSDFPITCSLTCCNSTKSMILLTISFGSSSSS